MPQSTALLSSVFNPHSLRAFSTVTVHAESASYAHTQSLNRTPRRNLKFASSTSLKKSRTQISDLNAGRGTPGSLLLPKRYESADFKTYTFHGTFHTLSPSHFSFSALSVRQKKEKNHTWLVETHIRREIKRAMSTALQVCSRYGPCPACNSTNVA
jgi:hypothetical protein